MTIKPITFRQACDFIAEHHRHHRPTVGCKFSKGTMRHNNIPRILALMLVVVMIALCILLAIPVHAAECRLVGKPEPEPWEPDPEDVAYISRTIWGEVRGCCEAEQRAQAWCVLNRVDDPRFPDTIRAVVTASNQFQGYSTINPVEPFAELAREILILWHTGKREIPEDMCWCEGDGKHQTFRNSWVEDENTRYYP